MTSIAQNAHIASISEEKSGIDTGAIAAQTREIQRGAIAVQVEEVQRGTPGLNAVSNEDYTKVKSWSREMLLLLGHGIGDKIQITCFAPKHTPLELQLIRGMAWIPPGQGKPQPAPVTGYITITPEGYSFTRQKKVNGEWVDHPSFKTYVNGYSQLKRLNEKGLGVYIRPNLGGNSDADITRCPNLFFEFDDLPKEEQWQQIDRLRALGYPPTLVNETYKSLHTYYRTTETTPEGWKKKEQQLIQYLGSDPSICNESRLMRLCGFKHWRYDEESKNLLSTPVKIREFDAEKFYSRSDFDKILPDWDQARWDDLKGDHTKSSPLVQWNTDNFSAALKNKDKETRDKTLWDENIAIRSPGDMRLLAPYQNGFNAQGRLNAATFKCTCNAGESDDSVHVSLSSGRWTTHHKNCSKKDVYAAALRTALAGGYKFQTENSDRPDSKKESSSDDSSLEKKIEQAEQCNRLDWYNAKVESEQKYLNTVTVKHNWTILQTHTKYFFNEIEDLIPRGKAGLVLCNLGMSRGKTTKNKKIVRDRPDVPVVGISSTISLHSLQAKDMELVPCSDVEGIYEQGISISKNEHIQLLKRISLCPPTLWRLIRYNSAGNIESLFSKTDGIVLLDEFRTVLNFLLQSSLANKDSKRSENIAALKWLLEDAVANNLLVLVDDANLTNVEIDFLTEICPDIPVYWVESFYKEPQKTYNFYVQVIDEAKDEDDEEQLAKGLDRAQFFVDMIAELAKGEPLLIPCDSVKLNAAIETKLKALGFNGDRVDADTSDRKEVKDYLTQDINRVLATRKPEFLLYSPTLGQSISIEVTEEYCAAIQEILRMTQEGASPEVIASAEAEAAILAKNWTSGTAYFTAKYCVNLHLGSAEFDQMIGRGRHPIPTYIYSSERQLPSSHSRSPLSQVQLNTITQYAEDFGEILEMAKLQIQREADERRQRAILENDQEFLDFLDLQDFENGTDTNETILARSKKILRQAREGFYPELTACAKQRARSAFEQKNRRESLKRHLVSKGNRIVDIEVIKADESIKEELKSIRQKLAFVEAEREVNAPLLSKEQEKILARKPSKTLPERDQLARYYFESEFPQLLSSFDNPVQFYYDAVKEDQRHYLNSVKLHWGYLNRKKLKSDDLCKLEFLHQQIDKTGCANFQDLKKLHSTMFKFLDEWNFFEVLGTEEVRRDDLEQLLDYVGKAKPRRQLKAYFDTSPPTPDKKLLPWLNRILARFALKLSMIRQDNNGLRYYKLGVQIPEELPRNAREKIISVLDNKIASKSSPEQFQSTTIPVSECNTSFLRTVVPGVRTTKSLFSSFVVRTIERVRQRFVEESFDNALVPRQRHSLKLRRLDGEAEAHLVATACSDPPFGYSRWTLRLLADQIVTLGYVESISHESVRQVLKKTKLSLG